MKQAYNLTISVGEESGHSLVGSSNLGFQKIAIKVLSGLQSHLKNDWQGRNPLTSSLQLLAESMDILSNWTIQNLEPWPFVGYHQHTALSFQRVIYAPSTWASQRDQLLLPRQLGSLLGQTAGNITYFIIDVSSVAKSCCLDVSPHTH